MNNKHDPLKGADCLNISDYANVAKINTAVLFDKENRTPDSFRAKNHFIGSCSDRAEVRRHHSAKEFGKTGLQVRGSVLQMLRVYGK